MASNSEVTRYIHAELRELARNDAFVGAVPAHFDGDTNGQPLADALLA